MDAQNINLGTKLKFNRLPRTSGELRKEAVETIQILERNQINTLESLVFQLLKELEAISVLRKDAETEIKDRQFSLDDEVRKFEINLIWSALIETGGVQCKAAKLLGVKSTTLNVKIKRYKINVNDFKYGSRTILD